MTSSDLKWPENITILPNVICLFIVFLIFNCGYQNWVSSHKMTSIWPQLPVVTWKHNSFTKFPLGHVICLILGFFGTLNQLHLSCISLEPTKDLNITSEWPQVTYKNLSCGHFICLFTDFSWCWIDCAHQIWNWSHLTTSQWPSNDLKWPIITWKHISYQI